MSPQTGVNNHKCFYAKDLRRLSNGSNLSQLLIGSVIMKTCSNSKCKAELAANYQYKTCEECRNKEKLKQQRRRTKKREKLLCLQCSQPVVEGKSFCAKCIEYKHEYYSLNASLEDASDKEARHQYYLQSKSKKLWDKATEMKNSAQARAEKEGVKCKVTAWKINDTLAKGSCELTGIPFEWCEPGQNTRGPWSPSLDRWDPADRNYFDDNTNVICWAANVFKAYWKTEDWMKLLRYCLVGYKLIDLPQEALAKEVGNNTQLQVGNIELDRTKFHNWIEQAKHRAAEEGASFDLEKADIEKAVLQGYCQVTGIPFDFSGIQQPDFSVISNPMGDRLASLVDTSRILGMSAGAAKKYFPNAQKPSDSLDYSQVTPLTPARTRHENGKHYNPWVPSLHRIDPNNRSYSNENTQCVVWAYNVARHNFSEPDFIKLIAALGQQAGLLPNDGSERSKLLDLLTPKPPVEVSAPAQPQVVAAPPKIEGPVVIEPKPPKKSEPEPYSQRVLSDVELVERYRKLFPHLEDEDILVQAKKLEEIKRRLLGR